MSIVFSYTARRLFRRALHSKAGESFLPKKGDHVVIAMSGGVDSSVAARLLANEDYNLSAVFMRNWDTRDETGTDRGCEWEKDWEDVRRVCKKLSLPCEMIDLSLEYWNRVFAPSLRLWESGNTPNPDVWCNREVKFGALMEHPRLSSARWLATGHYAGIDWDTSAPENPRPKLVRASHLEKDQTFYLSAVPESSLRKALFPLRNLSKEEVRKLALRYELPTATREESMGLCFVGERRSFNAFLSEYLPPNTGWIIDLETGKRVGIHSGLWNYTIGQGAKIAGMPEKMFVAKKDPTLNQVIVVPGSDHPALNCDGIVAHNFRWTWEDDIPSDIDKKPGLQARVQFRHRMLDISCTVRRRSDGGIAMKFMAPEKGVALGQIAAIYNGNWCLGSGIITETNHHFDSTPVIRHNSHVR